MTSIESATARIRDAIRAIPDFPQQGVLFRDITPVLADPGLLRETVRLLTAPWREHGITHVAAIESRGFVFGAPVALELGAGLVLMRKLGKLPARTEREEYELEYGAAALEVHADAAPAGARILVVDDVLATGGTARAACRLVERLGAEVVGCAFLVSIDALGGAERLDGYRLERLVRF